MFWSPNIPAHSTVGCAHPRGSTPSAISADLSHVGTHDKIINSCMCKRKPLIRLSCLFCDQIPSRQSMKIVT